jgi:2-polyprenyl-3-methyl-5-hydroxy-6-metoxy-1,4-benzoquinol methylase
MSVSLVLMKLPWLRGNFLARRRLDRIFVDPFDAVRRQFTGESHLPPYSLRAFVGIVGDFSRAGLWFLEDFLQSQLLTKGARVLDIGCGCGRLAYVLATDPRLAQWGISYVGVDVDRACISWCTNHIQNSGFAFRHLDVASRAYNPSGRKTDSALLDLLPLRSFDLIILTSVLTHLLPDELRAYLRQCASLLAPGGKIYASIFLLGVDSADPQRHVVDFPFHSGDFAVNNPERPANAIAYDQSFILKLLREYELEMAGPIRFGSQDVLILEKTLARVSSDS